VQPDGVLRNAPRWLLLFSLFGVCLFLSTILSSVWNYSATSYFSTPADPRYSLVTSAWTLPASALPAPAPGEVWYAPVIYFKVYPDVVVYFASILGAADLVRSERRTVFHWRYQSLSLMRSLRER